MRLTVQTDFALRMAMHLAVNRDRLSTIAEVADRYGISKNHLMKVAQALNGLGVIESIRGRSGGLRLAAVPTEISLGKIVRELENMSPLVECFPGGANACHIRPACTLKSILHEAQEAFFATLDRYTLHDLVSKNTDLHLLLMEDAA